MISCFGPLSTAHFSPLCSPITQPNPKFLTSTHVKTTVIVTNIAPGTSEATISEFFGFCGRITSIRLEDAATSITAFITFETSNAANTSLLLTNAMIADRPIQVALDPNAPTSSLPSAVPQEQFNPYPNTDEENAGESLTGGATRAEPNTATHVIAQLIAAGHKLSDTAAAEAAAFDERFQVSVRFNQGVEDVKETLNGWGERMGLTQKAQAAYETVATSAQSTGIPERANQAATATEDWFTSIARSTSAALQSAAASSAAWAEENMPTAVAKLREAGVTVGQQTEAIRVEANQLYPGAEELAQRQAPQEVHVEPESAVGDLSDAAPILIDHSEPLVAQEAPSTTTTATATTTEATPSIL